MKLTAKLADKIATQYNAYRDWGGKTELDEALAEVIRRQGGLCAALNEDARRDLILTLGENRRGRNKAFFAREARFAAAPVKIAAE